MRHQNYKSLPPALRLQRQRAREKKASLARRALVYALKAAPCLDCGRTYPHYVMDFDHRPGELKTLSVSALMMRGSLDDVMAEVAARCRALDATLLAKPFPVRAVTDAALALILQRDRH